MSPKFNTGQNCHCQLFVGLEALGLSGVTWQNFLLRSSLQSNSTLPLRAKKNLIFPPSGPEPLRSNFEHNYIK